MRFLAYMIAGSGLRGGDANISTVAALGPGQCRRRPRVFASRRSEADNIPLSDCTGWLREKPERPGDYAIWERSNDVLFSPPISRKNHLMCEFDITLLRQQATGQLLVEGGDIDSRLKTLFDALRKPSTEEAQTAAIAKRADDDPIHCLL